MGLNAKNGILRLPDMEMEYIRFGTGEKVLVMLPGLGDGLRSMKGTAVPMALMYRMFAKDYTVYAFSRRRQIPCSWSTRDMARDQKRAMDALGIRQADVFGVSMGGMIAQHLAIDYPGAVGKLILAVTAARPNPILTESVTEWIGQAEAGDHTALMDSNVRKIYSDGYYRRNRWMVPVMGLLTKPRSYDRFLTQADACLRHDAWDALDRITAPTLVIGGGQDRTLGGEASREIAARITGAQLKMYGRWGHGVYDEEPEFNREVLTFLQST